MIILVGIVIVLASVSGGFVIAGVNFHTLMHLSELVIIGGAAMGATVIIASKRVLIDMFRAVLRAFKGTPYKRKAYEELFMALHELFRLGRSNSTARTEGCRHRSIPSPA